LNFSRFFLKSILCNQVYIFLLQLFFEEKQVH